MDAFVDDEAHATVYEQNAFFLHDDMARREEEMPIMDASASINRFECVHKWM